MDHHSFPSQGDTLAGYKLERKLQQRGLIYTFSAFHKHDRRPAVVRGFKLPNPPPKEVFERIQYEAHMLHRLQLAQFAHILHIDWAPQTGLFWVYEGCDGPLLQNILSQRQRLPLHEACLVLQQLSQGLGEVHRHKLVHRALSPSCLVVLPREHGFQLRILGFSSSWLLDASSNHIPLQNQERIPYIAPEQITHPTYPPDPRMDVYTCAAILTHCITGYPPFGTSDHSQIIDSHMQGHAALQLKTLHPAGQFSEGMEHVLAKALHPNPSYRFHSVDEFWQAFEQAVHNQLASLRPRSHSYTPDGQPAFPANAGTPAFLSAFASSPDNLELELALDLEEEAHIGFSSTTELATAEEIRQIDPHQHTPLRMTPHTNHSFNNNNPPPVFDDSDDKTSIELSIIKSNTPPQVSLSSQSWDDDREMTMLAPSPGLLSRPKMPAPPSDHEDEMTMLAPSPGLLSRPKMPAPPSDHEDEMTMLAPSLNLQALHPPSTPGIQALPKMPSSDFESFGEGGDGTAFFRGVSLEPGAFPPAPTPPPPSSPSNYSIPSHNTHQRQQQHTPNLQQLRISRTPTRAPQTEEATTASIQGISQESAKSAGLDDLLLQLSHIQIDED